MSKYVKTKIINLDKTPYENGKTSGEYFKELIVSRVKKNEEILNKRTDLKSKCYYLLNKLKSEYPKYYEEVKGKAYGANVELLSYFSVLCPELFEIEFEHCTTIICKKKNGKFILSHNEDDDYIKGNFCLAKVKIDDNNWFVTNDLYNMPFGNGFSWNSYGIIKTINYCHEEEYQVNNLPRYFSQRHISEATSIEDLINRCKEMKIASGYHINAIDINKNIAVSIEVYKNDIDIKYIDDYYVHSNHFIHNEYSKKQITDEGSNSIFRLNKANELMRVSNIDIDSIKSILNYRSVNDKFEESIFQNENDPYITIANISFDTENKNKILLDMYINNESFILNYNIENYIKKDI